jgi:hypothetical protein
MIKVLASRHAGGCHLEDGVGGLADVRRYHSRRRMLGAGAIAQDMCQLVIGYE